MFQWFHILQKRIQQYFTKQRATRYYKKTTAFIQRKPFTAFLITLGLLLLIIIVGDIVSQPKNVPTAVHTPKRVSLYYIGTTPLATFQARIDKPGIIKILALSPGIVHTINVSEGETVYQGQQLFSLASNYQGGNAASIQSAIAAAQYQNLVDTFDAQQAVIQKQRDIANFTRDNISEEQAIATQSASDTSALMGKNQTLLDQLNAQFALDAGGGVSPATLVAEEAQINQLQGAQNQLRGTLGSLQAQTNGAGAQTHLADAQLDLTNQQLDLQSKSLVLNKEVAALQAQLADVNAATMFPASPFPATVERIYVRSGQLVTAGTPLAEISATKPHISAIVDVPENVAKNISSHDIATFTLNGKTYSILPSSVPTEATNGTLYSLIYSLPDELNNQLTDGDYISMSIPVGQPGTSATVPFIPLDAIYQTEDSSYVMVDKNDIATVRKVTIGSLEGSYAEVISGLAAGDRVILDRNVIAGDRVLSE